MGTDPCGTVNAPLDIHPEMLADFSASSIIRRATMRVPELVATTSSVARVSAEMGLKQRLPHNLSQISLRISGWILAERPPARNASVSRRTRSVTARRGSP